MCRESYPSRFLHEEFISTYATICPEVPIKFSNKEDAKKVCLAMLQFLKIQDRQYRLGCSLILLKREVVDDMERKRAALLVRHAVVLQKTVRSCLAKISLSRKRNSRHNLQAILKAQSILRRGVAQSKYIKMLGVVEEVKKRMSVQVGESNQPPIPEPEPEVPEPIQEVPMPIAIAEILDEQASSDPVMLTEECREPKKTEPEQEPELEEDLPLIFPELKVWEPIPEQEQVQPLCIRVQVRASGVTEALLFDAERLAIGFRKAAFIQEHKSFLHSYPDTFNGPSLLKWLCEHAGRALFGSAAITERNQQLSRSVARVLAQKLLAVGVYRQVKGNTAKPFEDTAALFRFREDEKNPSLLNGRSIWFKAARDPLYVVSELLYKMLCLRVDYPEKNFKGSEDLALFAAAATELQIVNINELPRVHLLAFYLNSYNLMVLHIHAFLGSVDGTDFSGQKVRSKHEYQYMIAAYNYTLAEIEERLFSRILRANCPKNSEEAKAPEPRVHFALSMGCASSPRIRIYQPETIDEELQQVLVTLHEHLNES